MPRHRRSETATRYAAGLIRDHEEWQKQKRDANGLFWQINDRNSMEVSIGGSGYRTTINNYQIDDSRVIARIAALAGKTEILAAYHDKATAIKRLLQENLWDKDSL